jgi:ubiquinone/menaquinone biosynthesis C-methylase UbiE
MTIDPLARSQARRRQVALAKAASARGYGGSRGCGGRGPLRGNIIQGTASLATFLLSFAAPPEVNLAAQPDSHKSAGDFAAQILQLERDAFSAGPLTVAQASPEAPRKTPDIHYVPTPEELVETMLNMAKVGKGDVVYDLGSGDGRLVITAAKEYGASGVGIDIDPQRIAESRENAKKAAVEDKVRFLEQDLFESDFHDATVVTLYLLGELNLRLRPQIFAQLKPGTRVVSHAFRMGDWEPDAQKTLEIQGNSYDAYYWVVPANMSGRWKVSGDKGEDLPPTVTVEQKFQEITVRSEDGAEVLAKGKINGATFTLVMTKNPHDRFEVFRGKIDGNTIEATETGSEEHHWRGTRESGSEKPLDPSAKSPP